MEKRRGFDGAVGGDEMEGGCTEVVGRGVDLREREDERAVVIARKRADDQVQLEHSRDEPKARQIAEP